MGYYDTRPTQPIGSGPPGAPVSLVHPEVRDDASKRRAYADLLVANGAPIASTYGIPTRNARFLFGEIKVKDVGESVDVKVWLRNKNSADGWVEHPNFGTLTVAGTSLDLSEVEILGADFVYLQFLNFTTSPLTSGVDAWLAGMQHSSRE